MNKQEEIDQVKQMREDYQKVFMRTAEGRRVLADLLAFTGIFELSFTGNSQTFFKEGKRAVGLKLLEALDAKTFSGLKALEQAGVTDSEFFTEG